MLFLDREKSINHSPEPQYEKRFNLIRPLRNVLGKVSFQKGIRVVLAGAIGGAFALGSDSKAYAPIVYATEAGHILQLSDQDNTNGPSIIKWIKWSQETKQEALQIVSQEYEQGHGKQSKPWVPVAISREGEESTSLNEDGAMDDYDKVDVALNGRNSLAYRNGQWTRIVLRKFFDDGVASGKLSEDWSGHCYGAGSASWGGPIIDGPINILGTEISALHRMQLQAWYYSTMRYDEWPEINDDVIAEIEDSHFANGEGIGANHTPVPGQEWWGDLIEVKEKGKLWVLRDFRKLSGEDHIGEDKTIEIDPHKLSSARIYHYDGPHQGRENDYNYFDRIAMGLITGTLQLVG